jgi:hypothetical protein
MASDSLHVFLSHRFKYLAMVSWLTEGKNALIVCVIGPPEWHSGLRHCISVLEASLQTRVQSQVCVTLAVTGIPIGWCTIGPVSSRLGEGVAGGGGFTWLIAL